MKKYEVLKEFKHPHTKKVYEAGEILELSPQAAIGLMGYVKKSAEGAQATNGVGVAQDKSGKKKEKSEQK